MSDDDEENEGSDKSDTESGQLITRRTKKLLRAKKQSAKSSEVPLNREAVGGSGYTLFFSSNSWLIFIRLHHIICERLACLKKRSEELIKEYEFEKQIRERQEKIYQAHGKAVASHPDNAVDVHLGLRDLKKPLQNPETFYPILIQELKNVLDGIIDGSAFEDNIRNMFGTTAYLMFTMDKLITTLTRQMQNFVTDQASVSSVSLFYKYCAHRAASLDPKQAFQVDEFYETAAEKVITNQNCFKMFFLHLSSPTLAWNEFLEKYIGDEDNSSEIIPSNLFLLRNMISRKLKTEVTFDFFSQSDLSDTPSFYINEGLRAVLSTENVKNLKLLYERGSSDILVKKGAPGDAKKTQQELSERRSQRFHDWLRHKKSADPDLSSDDYLFE
uniref:Sin3 C-terminal domain-containing protein n=1 Tax=Ditylenchus dipsaci TaxID=166011 RepID=A0A915ELY5_9BILA